MKELRLPSGNIDIVIDTDAFADSIYEMDDQFAIAYLLTFKQFNVKAFYCFQNDDGFAKGIFEVVKRCGREDLCDVVFKGGNTLLNTDNPQTNDAVADLIERSKGYTSENPLYVLGIGPLTNIGTALRIDPTISRRIVVVALMGHDFEQEKTDEYNLVKDFAASKVLMESETPLILVPCINVAKKLVMAYTECIEQWQGKNSIGDYLIYCMSLMSKEEYHPNLKRVIWDAVPVALLAKSELLTYETIDRPVLTDDATWGKGGKGKIIYVSDINEELIKKDIFERIKNHE